MLAALRIPIFNFQPSFTLLLQLGHVVKLMDLMDVSKIYFHLNWCFSLRKTIELSYCWWIWWIFRWIVLTWAASLSDKFLDLLSSVITTLCTLGFGFLCWCWWIWWIFRWIVFTWAAFLTRRQIPWSTFLSYFHP